MDKNTRTLRIAVAGADGEGLSGQVSAHFGRCPTYTVAEVRDGKVVGNEVVVNPHYANHVPGAVPRFLADLKADVVLAGGMGPRAIDHFRQYGIDVATGMSGKIGDAVDSWLRGELRGIVPCRADHPESCGHGHGHEEGGES